MRGSSSDVTYPSQCHVTRRSGGVQSRDWQVEAVLCPKKGGAVDPGVAVPIGGELCTTIWSNTFY
jgi:hypothetical protein